VGERVDQHREAERVRPEDELVALRVGDPAGGREHVDRGPPLVLGQSHLAHERVQTPLFSTESGESLLRLFSRSRPSSAPTTPVVSPGYAPYGGTGS
jgi:hypothetical protein